MSKIEPIPQLRYLKATLVLAFSPYKGTSAIWWSGIVKDMVGNDCVVVQVPKSHEEDFTKIARIALSAGGAKPTTIVEGANYNLLVLPADRITSPLLSGVTRKWKPRSPDIEAHGEWKQDVTRQLDDLGVTHLYMEYSGSGDSSNDDGWECFRSGEEGWYPLAHDNTGQHWFEQNQHKLPDELCTLISEYVWETLCQYDCVNNDGGGGDLAIDLSHDEPSFLFSCYTNEMVVTHRQNEEEV